MEEKHRMKSKKIKHRSKAKKSKHNQAKKKAHKIPEKIGKRLTEAKKKIREGEVISTPIDDFMDYLEKSGLVSTEFLAEKFKEKQKTIEEWANILEDEEYVEIIYPPIGAPRVRWVHGKKKKKLAKAKKSPIPLKWKIALEEIETRIRKNKFLQKIIEKTRLKGKPPAIRIMQAVRRLKEKMEVVRKQRTKTKRVFGAQPYRPRKSFAFPAKRQKKTKEKVVEHGKGR